jgi:hypothetical protein
MSHPGIVQVAKLLPPARNGHHEDRLLFTFLVVTVGISVACVAYDPAFYRKILGRLNPILLFPVAAVAAYGAFRYLRKFDLYFVDEALTLQRLLGCLLLGGALGSMPVLIDLWQRFPEDINVLFPRSVLFYPTIGVLAEIVFHLLPATLLLVLFRASIRKHPWVLVVLVAAVEPVFQVAFGLEANGLTLRDGLVFLEVFAFGLVQLRVFLKYGFFAMYVCRIGFYLTWHFWWGSMRLGI